MTEEQDAGRQTIDPLRTSQTWACRILGVTAPTIRDWETRGLPRNGDGTYDLRAAVAWLDQYRDSKRSNAGDARDRIQIAEARIKEAEARKREIATAAEAGQLVRARDVASWGVRLLLRARGVADAAVSRVDQMGLPDSIAPIVRQAVSSAAKNLKHEIQAMPEWAEVPRTLAETSDV